MSVPGWWAPGVRVLGKFGGSGALERVGNDEWVIRLDDTGGSVGNYVVRPDPGVFEPEVHQYVTSTQRERITHDCERALLRAFGCHYVPEWEGLPESVRMARPAHPQAVGRPELAPLQALVRGAIMDALSPYTTGP